MSRLVGITVVLASFALTGIHPLSAQGLESEKLLPATTAGFAAVENIDELREHWDKTQVGQLMDDPVMEPFAKDLRRQFEQRWARVADRLGLTLDDLRGVPSGEVAVAMVRPSRLKVATVLLTDVTGRTDKASALLDNVERRSKLSKDQPPKLEGIRLVMIDLPDPPEPEQPPIPSGFYDDPLPKRTGPRRAIYFLMGNILGAADDVGVIQDILARLRGGDAPTLADLPAYRQVMDRTAADAGRTTAQIRWFIVPLEYAEGARLTSTIGRRRKKDMIALVRDQGFDAIQGIGGFVDFAAEDYEVIHRTAIFAPPPYRRAMKMLAFPNGTDFTPPDWVPRELATYTAINVDIQNAFDNFGTLFDALFGGATFLFAVEGDQAAALSTGQVPQSLRAELADFDVELPTDVPVEVKEPDRVWEFRQNRDVFVARKAGGELRVYQRQTGLWEDVLVSLREDPHGPQLDLREDLIAHLGQRVAVMSDYELPITTTSERLLFAIETTQPGKVAEAIAKSMKNDPTARRREVHGYEVWEMVEEPAETASPDVSYGELPSLPPLDDPLQPSDDQEEPEEEERLLPHAAVTVAHGNLLVSSHLDFLVRFLDPDQPQRPLSGDIDYRIVARTLDRLGIEQRCLQSFSRTDEEYRPTYALIRQGRMPESETLLARMLNTVLGSGRREELRKQRIDGSKLPDFEVVRRYLGPAGAVITSEPNGWFAKGVILSKGAR